MKVTGHSEQFPKPICGLFYVDLEDPMAGGTGHTIRVCRQERVPLGAGHRFAPVVLTVPVVRPVRSRTVAPDPFGCTVLDVRPPASRKVVLPPVRDAVPSVRPAASR